MNPYYNLFVFFLEEMLKSLNESSSTLTSLSLEAFIRDVTALGQNYAFYELFSHPHINTIRSEMRTVLELFASLQFQDYSKNKERYVELNLKQIYSLRILTLLDIFEGKNILSFLQLESRLQLTSEELIGLLLKLSIEGRILVKIDEFKSTIRIIKTETRNKKITFTNESALKGKLNLIKVGVDHVKEKVVRMRENLQKVNKNQKKQQDQD